MSEVLVLKWHREAAEQVGVESFCADDVGGYPGDERCAEIIAAADPSAELLRDVAKALNGPLWLVWSNEHSAWWGANRRGYFMDIDDAGRYTLADAMDCCESRSRTSDNPPEVIQPSPEWHDARRAALARLAEAGVT